LVGPCRRHAPRSSEFSPPNCPDRSSFRSSLSVLMSPHSLLGRGRRNVEVREVAARRTVLGARPINRRLGHVGQFLWAARATHGVSCGGGRAGRARVAPARGSSGGGGSGGAGLGRQARCGVGAAGAGCGGAPKQQQQQRCRRCSRPQGAEGRPEPPRRPVAVHIVCTAPSTHKKLSTQGPGRAGACRG